MTTSPEQLFNARLAADPGGPLLTFYDDATGERAELSARSLANWVAKTHFLLLDDLGVTLGDRAFVGLPVHWLAAPILLGSWFAGLEVTSTVDGASVAFGDTDTLTGLDLAAVDDAFTVSLLSMARPGPPVAGTGDYATASRPMPDNWASVRPQAGPADPALDGLDRAGLVEAARDRAAELGLVGGGRLLWTKGFTGPADWISALLAPLAVGGSVVLARNPDDKLMPARVTGERVTVQS